MYELINKHLETNEDLPEYIEKQYDRVSFRVQLLHLTRNLTLNFTL